MRALFTAVPAVGHVLPMVPLARAMQAAGHEVVFATAADFALPAQRFGFATVPAGVTVEGMTAARARSVNSVLPGEDPVHTAVKRFARLAPAMVDDLVRICSEWQPDLLVHEEAEMGGPLAARIAGVPNVNHSWASPVIPGDQADLVTAELESLWRRWDVEPEPVGGRYEFLHVDTCPPSLQGDGGPNLTAVQRLRPFEVATPAATAAAASGRPTVYVTFGTVPLFNAATEIFAAAIEGLADEDVTVVVSVWANNDPARFGPLPGNVTVECEVDQQQVLQHCVAAIVHGGPGSTVGALAHGVPVLVIPPSAPIFSRVRDGVLRAGAGIALAPSQATAGAIRAAVGALRQETAYRRAAESVAGEIATMPPPEQVVTVLEEIAT